MGFTARTPEEVVAAAVERFASEPGGLLPLLHDIHAQLGYVPREQVPEIARGVGLSRAEVHGVIGFYHDFHDQPRGRTTIHVCCAEACQAMGSRSLAEHIERRLGIGFGETTTDGRFSLEPVYCLGNCACSPSVRIGDEVHARVDADAFDALIGSRGE